MDRRKSWSSCPQSDTGLIKCWWWFVDMCSETSWAVIYMKRGLGHLVLPFFFCVKGHTSATPAHNTSRLRAFTPESSCVTAAGMLVQLPPPAAAQLCVGFSGWYQCSAPKLMDQVRWLLSTVVGYNTVTRPSFNISAVFSNQLLWTSALAVSGLLNTRPALNAKLTRLFSAPPAGVHEGSDTLSCFCLRCYHCAAVTSLRFRVTHQTFWIYHLEEQLYSSPCISYWCRKRTNFLSLSDFHSFFQVSK